MEDEINIKTLIPGDAVHFPRVGDSCIVHYIGYLADGLMFDNSYQRNQPLCFVLGQKQVIQGWEEVLQRMSRGQKAEIEIPPEKAYGNRGYPPVIPPLSTLRFEIELISFSNSEGSSEVHQIMDN